MLTGRWPGLKSVEIAWRPHWKLHPHRTQKRNFSGGGASTEHYHKNQEKLCLTSEFSQWTIQALASGRLWLEKPLIPQHQRGLWNSKGLLGDRECQKWPSIHLVVQEPLLPLLEITLGPIKDKPALISHLPDSPWMHLCSCLWAGCVGNGAGQGRKKTRDLGLLGDKGQNRDVGRLKKESCVLLCATLHRKRTRYSWISSPVTGAQVGGWVHRSSQLCSVSLLSVAWK